MRLIKLIIPGFLVLCFLNLSADLVSRWDFENNWVDSYGDQHVVNHGASFDGGKVGRGIYFNDDQHDYVELGEESFDPRGSVNSFSLSMWVKTGTSNEYNNCYIGKHRTGSNEFLFGYWSSKLTVQIGNAYKYVSSASEPVGIWTHYVVTSKDHSSSSSVEVYKNGTQIWSGYISDVMSISPVDSKKWVLGMEWDGSSSTDHFQGTMDQVKFFDKVISSDEVLQIYTKESALVHLDFDDNYEDRMGNADGDPSRSDITFYSGMENRAVDLSGASTNEEYIEIGDDGSFDPRGSSGFSRYYSMSIWVNADVSASTGDNHSYIGKHTSGGVNVFLFGYFSNMLRVYIKGEHADITTSTEPTTWTHYVVTGRERTSYPIPVVTDVVVYKNGSQIYSGTINASMGTFASTDHKWVLGQDWDSATYETDEFDGKIDNFRFYDRVLTLDEVQALYQSEFTGVRYCNGGQDSQCTVKKGTEFNLSTSYWWVQSGLFGFLVPTSNIESIRVSEGWEAYLCSSTNNDGTCKFFGEGLYDDYDLTTYLENSTYSMTVHPSEFKYAVKQYGIREIDESGNEPTGFAYLYKIPEYRHNLLSYKRMFIKSNDTAINGLSNYILKNDDISSAELFGDIVVKFSNSTYGDKTLYSSHRDLSWFGYDNNNDYLDFTDYNNDISYVFPMSKPSVGWFFSNDSSDENNKRKTCFKGVTDFPQSGYGGPKIECITYDENHYAYRENVDAGQTYDHDKFYGRVVDPNPDKRNFTRYTDSYDLLFYTPHGNFNYYTNTTIPYVLLAVTGQSSPDYLLISSNSDWSSNIGKLKTKWMLTTGCNTMGRDGFYLQSDTVDVYKKSLERLNGVGGYWNSSWWGGSDEDHEYYDFWDELNSEPVSEAWVDAWTSGDPSRDARYMTRETCDCNYPSTCNSFMFHDYFPTVSTGPKDRKDLSQLSSYDHYCFRDDSSVTHYHISKNGNEKESPFDQDIYSRDEVVVKIYETKNVPDSVIKDYFGIEVSENGKTKSVDEDAFFTLEGRRLFYKVNDVMSSIEDDSPMEYNNYETLFLDDAKKVAENLTTIPVVFDRITLDVTTSFVDDGFHVEEESRKANVIKYTFTPVLDNIPMIFNKIEIQYDAKGLYKIKSFAPYSAEETGVSQIKDVEKLLYEAGQKAGIDLVEFDASNVVYIIDENGNARVNYVSRDDEGKMVYTTIMEKNHE